MNKDIFLSVNPSNPFVYIKVKRNTILYLSNPCSIESTPSSIESVNMNINLVFKYHNKYKRQKTDLRCSCKIDNKLRTIYVV